MVCEEIGAPFWMVVEKVFGGGQQWGQLGGEGGYNVYVKPVPKCFISFYVIMLVKSRNISSKI